jgi:alpha-L-arabinofuranosidase
VDSVQSVVILPHEPIGEINPYLHGHFAEHLGELVYNGVWVGPDSPIPNTDGIRNDVVEALKPLGIPVLRWPGGCFADDYHWRDGIGPRESRPMRINTHWGMAPEPNHFGTHEFIAFCRALGAEPYFAGNLGSGTPNELRDWVEYCNFGGDSALANERRANGAPDPFSVKFWGIGNENWGCGGDMNPEQYADEYFRYRVFVNNYPDAPIEAIACGPNGADWAWTRRFFERASKYYWDRLRRVQGFAAHYYCGTAGTATEYTEAQWLELLAKARAVEGIVTGHRTIMDEFDPERKIKLLLDEWGAWHPVEAGKPRSGLYQQNTIRDACVAALSLDVFHNHADKLHMANIAQLINVLQSLLLVQEDRCLKTPTYHVFDLYKAHQGGTAVRLISEAETISDGGDAAEHCRRCYRDRRPLPLQAVHGSASVNGDTLCITLTNPHPTQAIEADIALHRGSLGSVEVTRLVADEIHAHNTFENPNVVQLSAPETLSASGSRLRVPLPAGSIARITGTLTKE